MRRIGSKNTKPEMTVRRMLHRLGYRYVLHSPKLPGHPDLAFPARKKVLFVHGCFWHGHACPRGFKPKINAAFWAEKIKCNQARDLRHLNSLRDMGWKTMVVWECEASTIERCAQLEPRLIAFLEPSANPII